MVSSIPSCNMRPKNYLKLFDTNGSPNPGQKTKPHATSKKQKGKRENLLSRRFAFQRNTERK